MEYVGTISKLKDEISSLKNELALKTKEEERLKDQVKKLEECEKQFTNTATVFFIGLLEIGL